MDAGDLDPREPEDFGETRSGAARIVNRHRRVSGERSHQCPRRPGGLRMGQRFVEGVPSARIVKGLDAQGHDCEPITTPHAAGASDQAPRVYRQPGRSRAASLLPKCRHGQGGIFVDPTRPRREAARSMPPRAKITATPRVVATATSAPAMTSLG